MKQEIKRETLNTRIKPSLLKKVREASKEMNISQSDLVESALVSFLVRSGHIKFGTYKEGE